MKFNYRKLEKTLKKTGLPYHSMPFIHGGLTALVIAPDFIEIEIEIGAPYMVLFDVEPDKIPEMGIDDPSFEEVLDDLDEIEMYIDDDVERGCYRPFLGDRENNDNRMDMVREWCRGFINVVLLVGSMPQENKDTNNSILAFASIMIFSGLAEELAKKETAPVFAACEKDPYVFLSGCVDDVNIFWREKEGEYENEELFPPDAFDDSLFEPVVRDNPKIQRNDPCSCGSGKKYKKCCGINGDSHILEFPTKSSDLKNNNIIDFPGNKPEKNNEK
jgi:uncharacterized protein YecA (UPF0149 family)